jgi:hypothetical protein
LFYSKCPWFLVGWVDLVYICWFKLQLLLKKHGAIQPVELL